MASKKLPKKINVSIVDDKKSSKGAKKASGKDGNLVKAAKEALREVETDDRFQKSVNRYNYKKGSPKNKNFMNHDVPQGQEKKTFWLWVSVGTTLFFVFFLWIGTMLYLDFFKIDRTGQDNRGLDVITDDIKNSYNDFTSSLGDIGSQIDGIKEDLKEVEELPLDEEENKEPIIEKEEEEEVSPNNILESPGLEVIEN